MKPRPIDHDAPRLPVTIKIRRIRIMSAGRWLAGIVLIAGIAGCQLSPMTAFSARVASDGASAAVTDELTLVHNVYPYGAVVALGGVLCEGSERLTRIVFAHRQWETLDGTLDETLDETLEPTWRKAETSNQLGTRLAATIALDTGLAFMRMKDGQADAIGDPISSASPKVLVTAYLRRGAGLLRSDGYATEIAEVMAQAGFPVDGLRVIEDLETLAIASLAHPALLKIAEEQLDRLPDWDDKGVLEPARWSDLIRGPLKPDFVSDVLKGDADAIRRLNQQLQRAMDLFGELSRAQGSPTEPAEDGLLRALKRVAFPFIIGRRTAGGARGTDCVIWAEQPDGDVHRIHYAYLKKPPEAEGDATTPVLVDYPLWVNGEISFKTLKLDMGEYVTIPLYQKLLPGSDGPKVFVATEPVQGAEIDDLEDDAPLAAAIASAGRLWEKHKHCEPTMP